MGRSGRLAGPTAVVLAALALGLIYLALSFLNAPGGTLSTDVGGKVATLEAMQQGETTSPDLGYWAREWDPTAKMHGLYNTSVADGKFVNVTTLPVLELARPLYEWGGYRAALLWSMVGAIGASFAARALARRAGGDETRAWMAFWLTGLASPVLLYALDLWEHAPGLALMAWGVVAMIDVAAGRSRWCALAAGAAFGLAYSMRTEALAYGFAIVAVGCVLVLLRRGAQAAVSSGALAAIGFGVLAVGNFLLETALVGTTLRSARASGTVSSGGTDLALRLKEAAVTSFGLFPDLDPGPLLAGAVALGLLAWAVWRDAKGRDQSMTRVAVAGAVALFLLRAVDGAGFVPGLLAVAPFGVVALVLPADRRVARPGRDGVLMVLIALPVVWYFQYTGGALPQWGGRYVLTTGLVLAAVGIGASGLLRRWLVIALSGLSIGVAVFGLAWMSHRTHEVVRAADTIARVDVPIISAQGFWLREVGEVYTPESRWLSVAGMSDVDEAAEVVALSGEDEFDLLWVPIQWGEVPEVSGWRAVGGDQVEHWMGVDFHLTRYERT